VPGAGCRLVGPPPRRGGRAVPRLHNANYNAATLAAANGLALKMSQDDTKQGYNQWQEGKLWCNWTWDGWWKPTLSGLI